MESKRALINAIAEERIGRLFHLAENSVGSDDKLARSYVALLERISSHYKVGIPRSIRSRICKRCMMALVPGANCSVVLASSKKYIVYKCRMCGGERHVYYK